jgi:acid phosphatase type 7
VIGIITLHESLGYLIPMGNRQPIGGIGAARRRTARGVVAATVAVLLLAVGCDLQPTPSAEGVVAAGDIAKCGTEGDEATAELVEGIDGATVLALGDEAYPRGSAANFEECYGPSWGRFKGRTKPVPGNHEYYTQGARSYFGYFAEAAGDPDEGYYSYELGSWHIVALNSNCGEAEIRCSPSSVQVRWLEEDLAANDEEVCTLAYFHHPLFTSGEYRPGIDSLKPLWEALHAAGVDVVLNAHDHNYQRFAPQDPQGRADPEGGIRQFVVGTGGGKLHEISDPIANTEVYNDNAYGVLELTLRPKGYEWEFVPVEGESFTDSGAAQCH